MKSRLQTINSRLGETQNQLIDVAYKEEETTQSKQQKEKGIQEKNEDNVRCIIEKVKYTAFRT